MATTSKERATQAAKYPGASFWAFGDSAPMADELGALGGGGIKTASAARWRPTGRTQRRCALATTVWVLDGRERPLAIIRTTALRLLRFCDVTAEMAAKEGEGDLSLAYWRAAYRAFFERAGHGSEKRWRWWWKSLCWWKPCRGTKPWPGVKLAFIAKRATLTA